MPLLILGINHQTAPVDIREKVSFAPERMVDAMQQAGLKEVNEAIIVSTCNRTEPSCQVSDLYKHLSIESAPDEFDLICTIE